MGKRKLAHISDSEDDEKDGSTKGASEGGASDEEIPAVEVKVVGEIVKKAGGKGKVDRKLYQAFEADGNRYEIDDVVLITPEQSSQKPYVALIKEIKQAKDGTVQVTGQWFYRPEEAEKKGGGGTWLASDSRELFYSFHVDELPAESVMHKCQAHFVPPHKQLPLRAQHPGFIVRQVYDACEKKLFDLTDKDYEDPMRKEIDRLVEKTREVLGELPDIDGAEAMALADEEASPEVKIKRRVPARRTMAPLNVKSEGLSVNEVNPVKGDPPKLETPTSCVGADSEVSTLLKTHGVLVGVHARDRWLEKLVQTIRELCLSGKDIDIKNGEDEVAKEEEGDGGKQRLARTKGFLGEGALAWPEVAPAATEVVSALERLTHEALGNDLHKYNLKMRQLDFNIKNNKVLARRLLSKELEPATGINMSPAELKKGYTDEETSDQEPSEQETIEMADVRCSICGEREVGVVDIIHVGYGDRYQLECQKCGHTWYSSMDAISPLVIKTVAAPNVGIAPWATSKFEEVEKDLTSPRASAAPAVVDAASGNVAGTDIKSPPAPHRTHYQDVENTLAEKLPVTNPVAKDFVNINAQEAMGADMALPAASNSSGVGSRNSDNKMDTSSKPERVIPHPETFEDLPSGNHGSQGSGVPTGSGPQYPPLGHQGSTVGTIQSVPVYGEEETVSKRATGADATPARSSDTLPAST